MKYKRQGQILRIIHEKNIKTHEQLIGELNKCGYNVTQATVSRDIKELGLIKIPLPDGGSVYSSSKDIPEELDRRINMITDTVISVDYAMNNIVVKTYPGMASAVAASVDASMRNEFLGSIAGDDTLLIIARNEEKAAEIAEKLKNRDEKKKLFAGYAEKAKKELENVWGIEIYGDFTEKRTGYDIGMVMLRGKTKSGEDTMTEYDMLGDHIVDFYYM